MIQTNGTDTRIGDIYSTDDVFTTLATVVGLLQVKLISLTELSRMIFIHGLQLVGNEENRIERYGAEECASTSWCFPFHLRRMGLEVSEGRMRISSANCN